MRKDQALTDKEYIKSIFNNQWRNMEPDSQLNLLKTLNFQIIFF